MTLQMDDAVQTAVDTVCLRVDRIQNLPVTTVLAPHAGVPSTGANNQCTNIVTGTGGRHTAADVPAE